MHETTRNVEGEEHVRRRRLATGTWCGTTGSRRFVWKGWTRKSSLLSRKRKGRQEPWRSEWVSTRTILKRSEICNGVRGESVTSAVLREEMWKDGSLGGRWRNGMEEVGKEAEKRNKVCNRVLSSLFSEFWREKVDVTSTKNEINSDGFETPKRQLVC